jgi:hypothetical protein
MRFASVILATIVFASSALSARAQSAPNGLESAVVSALQAKGVTRGTIVAIRSYGGYATAWVTVGDSTATVYLKQNGSTWRALHVGGGIASPSEVERYGLPSVAVTHLRSGAGTTTYRTNRIFGRAIASHPPVSRGSSSYSTHVTQLIVYACKRYVQTHVGGQSFTVTRGVGIGRYGLCSITNVPGDAEVLVRKDTNGYRGLGYAAGPMAPAVMVRQYHVPANIAAALSNALLQSP